MHPNTHEEKSAGVKIDKFICKTGDFWRFSALFTTKYVIKKTARQTPVQ
jgi:hypothetical protein